LLELSVSPETHSEVGKYFLALSFLVSGSILTSKPGDILVTCRNCHSGTNVLFILDAVNIDLDFSYMK